MWMAWGGNNALLPMAWQWGGMALGQHGVAMHLDGMGQ
jgi:hypothetical protein